MEIRQVIPPKSASGAPGSSKSSTTGSSKSKISSKMSSTAAPTDATATATGNSFPDGSTVYEWGWGIVVDYHTEKAKSALVTGSAAPAKKTAVAKCLVWCAKGE